MLRITSMRGTDKMSEKIRMAHGSGGQMSSRLIAEVFYPAFGSDAGNANDSAILNVNAGRIAFTTDGYVVSPIFFPGGDIGKLAFCGTVNDLATAGARPIALSASFIIEEGMDIEDLKKIALTMGELSRATGIPIVTGDTKVVEKGSADKVFITTTGIGIIPDEVQYHPKRIKEGDKIIISGTIGDHGYCITALRAGLDIKSNVTSDCQPLYELVHSLAALGNEVHSVRDATRGGVGTVLNEWADQSANAILIYENKLPIKAEVKGGCALLGLDPIYLANEGKMLFAVSADKADEALELIKSISSGRDAAIIGEVKSGKAQVTIETEWGTTRIVPVPRGEILPRIC